MVGKLMKYEFQAIFRVLMYMAVVSLGLACISRILIAAGSENLGSYLLAYLAIMAACIMLFTAFIVSASRFWQSLFKGEGYMTFSLPVSTTQLLIAKLLSAVIAMFAGVAVFALSTTIICSGFSGDLWEEIKYIVQSMLEGVGSYLSSDPLLIFELIVQLIVGIPTTLLLFYLIESLGQLFTNHRKGYTFGIGVAVIIVLSLLEGLCLEPILNAAMKVSVHLSNWIQIIVFAAVDVGCFFLVRYLLSKKLNLVV